LPVRYWARAAGLAADQRTTKFVRQVLGAVGKLEMTVTKLRGARERKPGAGLVRRGEASAFALPRKLYGLRSDCIGPPVTHKRVNLRKISAELATVGHMMVRKYRGNDAPRPFNPATIKTMIDGPPRIKNGSDAHALLLAERWHRGKPRPYRGFA
jgi:hypothetical protein